MKFSAANNNDAPGRAGERAAFLRGTDFATAEIVPLGSDASIRQYFRLVGGPAPALLMDAPAAATTPPCPPGADKDERRSIGYSALVRGSGNSIAAYEAAAAVLDGAGLLVPRLLARDLRAGFAIVEDLGDQRVADAATDRQRETELYHLAADGLDLLREKSATADPERPWPFQTYDTLAYRTEAELLASWYLPHQCNRTLTKEEAHRLDEAWVSVLRELSPPKHWCHRDFHAENLMVSEGRVGVLDFQDLMVGQAAYDWASLIEDARRDISMALARDIYERGVRGADDPETFARDYAILAAQRNAKILGLFARLAVRDGKQRYLELLPRVEAFFKNDLQHQDLTPVREVLLDLAPELVF